MFPTRAADLVQTDYDIFDGRFYLHQPSMPERQWQNPHYYTTPGSPPPSWSRPRAPARVCMSAPIQTKMYSVTGKYLHFSMIGDPTHWVPQSITPANTGAGNINSRMQDADSESC